jgi:hypothetical protein
MTDQIYTSFVSRAFAPFGHGRRARHREHAAVAARGGNHRDADACVPARRLDENAPPGGDVAARFGGRDHARRNAVLDGAAG